MPSSFTFRHVCQQKFYFFQKCPKLGTWPKLGTLLVPYFASNPVEVFHFRALFRTFLEKFRVIRISNFIPYFMFRSHFSWNFRNIPPRSGTYSERTEMQKDVALKLGRRDALCWISRRTVFLCGKVGDSMLIQKRSAANVCRETAAVHCFAKHVHPGMSMESSVSATKIVMSPADTWTFSTITTGFKGFCITMEMDLLQSCLRLIQHYPIQGNLDPIQSGASQEVRRTNFHV